MRSNPLTQNVHMVISIAFILSFGLFATSITLKLASLEDPITNTLAVTMEESL